MLTGRNHHSVAMGGMTEVATGYPGYNGQMPKDKATIAAMLRQEGYSTFCLGKWHNTPADETGPSGPFDRWPTGEMMGFERFYGFLGAETNQWYPALVADNHVIESLEVGNTPFGKPRHAARGIPQMRFRCRGRRLDIKKND